MQHRLVAGVAAGKNIFPAAVAAGYARSSAVSSVYQSPTLRTALEELLRAYRDRVGMLMEARQEEARVAHEKRRKHTHPGPPRDGGNRRALARPASPSHPGAVPAYALAEISGEGARQKVNELRHEGCLSPGPGKGTLHQAGEPERLKHSATYKPSLRIKSPSYSWSRPEQEIQRPPFDRDEE